MRIYFHYTLFVSWLEIYHKSQIALAVKGLEVTLSAIISEYFNHFIRNKV